MSPRHQGVERTPQLWWIFKFIKLGYPSAVSQYYITQEIQQQTYCATQILQSDDRKRTPSVNLLDQIIRETDLCHVHSVIKVTLQIPRKDQM